MTRNFYLLLIAVTLIGSTACKKESTSNKGSGNVTGNTGGTDVPAGAGDGVTFINGGKSVIFNLYAPLKKSVSVIGDFNNWQANTASAMKNSTDGTRWWVQIDNLDPTKEYAYQYVIDGSLKVADPYTNKVLDPANDPGVVQSGVYPNLKAYPAGQTGIVSTFWYSAPAYSWKTTNFTRPDPKSMVVYELLVRDFVGTHSYQTLTDTLNYLVRLGVNAVELLPVNEFEGNDSWGYNSNFMFALDKYYGTPNDYKAFIDACHAKGIAVIQDIVLEDQFGSSPLVQMYWNSATKRPAANNPWIDVSGMHPDTVGYQMNHQSAATQYFTKNVMKYWIQEYHIDGYRFDEAKGFTQTPSADETSWANYDAGRVQTWTNYNAYMKSLDPNFYVILEYFAGSQEQSQLATLGMYMWNNLSSQGEQATMGYATNPSWDISGLFYDSDGMTSPNLINYFESHDQERLQFKNEAYGNSNGSYTTKDIPTGLKRDEMLAAFMFASPGPKMVWQFGERGYDVSIDDATTGGRLGDKPQHWEYMSDPNRAHLYAMYAKFIKWKIKNPVFNSTTYTYNLTGTFKFAQLLGSDGTDLEVIGNFDVASQTANVAFPSTGTWTDNVTGTSINVTALPYSITLAPGEYHMYSNKPLQ